MERQRRRGASPDGGKEANVPFGNIAIPMSMDSHLDVYSDNTLNMRLDLSTRECCCSFTDKPVFLLLPSFMAKGSAPARPTQIWTRSTMGSTLGMCQSKSRFNTLHNSGVEMATLRQEEQTLQSRKGASRGDIGLSSNGSGRQCLKISARMSSGNCWIGKGPCVDNVGRPC